MQSHLPFRFPNWRTLAGLILLGLPLAGLAQEGHAWLMLNTTIDDSVLVADPAEKGKLQQDGWKIDGEMLFFSASDPGARALHRMARPGPSGTDRMLSTDAGEVAARVKDGFADEGVLGLVVLTQSRPELVPVFHFRKEKKNLWLMDKDGQAWAEKNGWKLEGVGFWVFPAAAR